MTLDEFRACHIGVSIEEWEKIIKRRQKRDNRIRKISDQIFECKDALEVLADEKGSKRWNKWNDKLIALEEELWNLKYGKCV